MRSIDCVDYIYRSIKLPVASLLKQFKEQPTPLIRHFDLLYIQQGIDRIPIFVCDGVALS